MLHSRFLLVTYFRDDNRMATSVVVNAAKHLGLAHIPAISRFSIIIDFFTRFSYLSFPIENELHKSKAVFFFFGFSAVTPAFQGVGIQ